MVRLKSFWTSLSGINLAYILVLALVVKALAADVSYAAFLLTIPVLGFEAYKLYLKTKTPDPVVINQEVREEIDKLKAKVNASMFEKGASPTAISKRYF